MTYIPDRLFEIARDTYIDKVEDTPNGSREADLGRYYKRPLEPVKRYYLDNTDYLR